jgi:kynureninase
MASPDGQSQHVNSKDYAVSLDAQDALSLLRKEFLIPSKAELKAKTLSDAGKEGSWIAELPLLIV